MNSIALFLPQILPGRTRMCELLALGVSPSDGCSRIWDWKQMLTAQGQFGVWRMTLAVQLFGFHGGFLGVPSDKPSYSYGQSPCLSIFQFGKIQLEIIIFNMLNLQCEAPQL
jgi:hypothetical protein